MQEPYPVDIFATKGVEYLLVLGFLAVLVLFIRLFLSRPAAVAAPAGQVSRWFTMPGELFFHRGHTWARPEGNDLVRVGLDDFAQKLVGVPSDLFLPEVGERLHQGERAWKVSVGSKEVDLLSPVDGEVVERNDAVLRNPELVNRDPYGDGWLCKVRPARRGVGIPGLMRGRPAREWMEATEETLRRLVSPTVGVVLQDGGAPVTGIAASLSEEKWDEIAREFLNPR